MSYSASFPIHVRIWFSYFFGFVPMNMHLSKTFKFYDSPHLWHTHLPRLSAPPTPLSTASLLHYGTTTPQHYKLFFFFFLFDSSTDSTSPSLLVAWIHIINKRRFWSINVPDDCHWNWKNILNLRPITSEMAIVFESASSI